MKRCVIRLPTCLVITVHGRANSAQIGRFTEKQLLGRQCWEPKLCMSKKKEQQQQQQQPGLAIDMEQSVS